MSARRHRNDGSQQKPLHVWFSVRRRLFFNFGGCAGLYSKLTNCESYQKGWLPIRMGSLLFRTRNLRRNVCNEVSSTRSDSLLLIPRSSSRIAYPSAGPIVPRFTAHIV